MDSSKKYWNLMFSNGVFKNLLLETLKRNQKSSGNILIALCAFHFPCFPIPHCSVFSTAIKLYDQDRDEPIP